MNVRSLLSIVFILGSFVSASPLPEVTTVVTTSLVTTTVFANPTPTETGSSDTPASNDGDGATEDVASDGGTSETTGSVTASPTTEPTSDGVPYVGQAFGENSLQITYENFDSLQGKSVDTVFGKNQIDYFVTDTVELMLNPENKHRGYRVSDGRTTVAMAANYVGNFEDTSFDNDAFKVLVQRFVDSTITYQGDACAIIAKKNCPAGMEGCTAVRLFSTFWPDKPDGKLKNLCKEMPDDLSWPN